MNLKPKKCRVCKVKFTPYNSLQVVCSKKCAISYVEAQKAKKWKKEKKKLKEGLMTHKDWVKIAQKSFNSYVRERDRGKLCISCNKLLNAKFDAGHCFPAGHYPNIRFDEDNVHGQCVECNQHKHGNQAEYLLRLPARIGQEKVDELVKRKDESNKLSIPELQELVKEYKEKRKKLLESKN